MNSKQLTTIAFRITTLAVAALILCGCGETTQQPNPPAVGLHEAAVQGDLQTIRAHIAAGSDLNERDPLSGASPLITAAAFGQTAVAQALVDAGADLNHTNNEGATALHTAAFLCRAEIVELLLAKGADKNLKNNAGATALDSVTGPFDQVKPIYDLLGNAFAPLGLTLDYDRLKATRPQIAAMLR